MVSDRDDDYLLTVNHVDDSVRPSGDRTASHTFANSSTDLRKPKQQREFGFDCFYESFAVSVPLLFCSS